MNTGGSPDEEYFTKCWYDNDGRSLSSSLEVLDKITVLGLKDLDDLFLRLAYDTRRTILVLF